MAKQSRLACICLGGNYDALSNCRGVIRRRGILKECWSRSAFIVGQSRSVAASRSSRTAPVCHSTSDSWQLGSLFESGLSQHSISYGNVSYENLAEHSIAPDTPRHVQSNSALQSIDWPQIADRCRNIRPLMTATNLAWFSSDSQQEAHIHIFSNY